MNKRHLPLLILLTFALAALALAWTNGTVHAQGGCTDAAGRPIPCPGNDNKKTPTPVPPTATFTPTATVTPIPTNTSLPISNPTDDGGTEVKWSGTCAGVNKNTTCTDKLINACNKAGGTPDASFDDEADTTTITCTLPAMLEPTPLPIVIPTDDGSSVSGSGYTGTCDSSQEKFLTCIMDFVDGCIKDGGSSSVSGSDGNITTLTCTTTLVIVPTPLPLAVPSGNHIGSCNANDEDFQECMDEQERQCEDGTLVIKVDLYGGDGTSYDFYCIPHKPTFPPGDWLPWIAGLGGLLIGMLLPAIQKVRFKPGKEPQAASGNTSQTTWGSGNNDRGKAHNSDMSAKPEESEAAVAIPAFMKNARKAKTAEATTEEESMQLRSKRAEVNPASASGALKTIAAAETDYNEPPAEEEDYMKRGKRSEAMPQTREHVLLAKQPTNSTEGKSDPEPAPKPPPPPPPRGTDIGGGTGTLGMPEI